MSYRGVNDIPLAYVIRKIPRDTTINTSREIEIIYDAPLTGAACDSDNIEVYCIINQFTFEQHVNNWIKCGSKTCQNGRQSILDLRQHYNGGNKKHKILQTSRVELKLISYKSNYLMTYQLCSSNM